MEPENTSDLAVEPGQDLVTLLTCTPYAVNTKRLLVRGHRVPYEEETIEKEEKESPMSLYQLSVMGSGRACSNRSADHFLMAVRQTV